MAGSGSTNYRVVSGRCRACFRPRTDRLHRAFRGGDDILAASHGVGRHPSARAKPSGTRVIPALVAMVSGPFARAMLTAFFFFGSLNGFVLLPLYIHRLGGTEASIGTVSYTHLTLPTSDLV